MLSDSLGRVEDTLSPLKHANVLRCFLERERYRRFSFHLQ